MRRCSQYWRTTGCHKHGRWLHLATSQQFTSDQLFYVQKSGLEQSFIMRGTYPGPRTTLGHPLVFGHLAAVNAVTLTPPYRFC